MEHKFEKVEKKLGVKLPDAYKVFASQYGNMRVREGTWISPHNLQVLDNFETIDNDLSFIDTPAKDLKKLIPLLVDENTNDLVMLDYRHSETMPEVFTIQSEAMEKRKKYKTFSDFLDTTCKNYRMKAKYLDVVDIMSPSTI